MTILKFLSILSALVLYVFMERGIRKFGALTSYSSYAKEWWEAYPKWLINPWHLFTWIAALLIVPVLIEVGAASSLQFLGFFAPVYLIGVSFTPNWWKDNMEHTLHMVFAGLCAVCGIAWSIFVVHTLPILIFNIIIVAIGGLYSKTLWTHKVFWGELIAFNTVYMSLAMIV